VFESVAEIEVSRPNLKQFKFNHNITLNLTLTKLYSMYDGLVKNDYKLLALLYLSSPRCRQYMTDNFPSYFSYISKEMEDYEYHVENTFSKLVYDIQTDSTHALGVSGEAFETLVNDFDNFVETEMDMWIRWAFNKHTDEKNPVHLLRYIIGNSLI
jgi:hypothetical protein